MSTRATYRFENRLRANCASHPALTLYIHHDGYPSGAAYYFWEAHHFANRRGGMVTAFIRANDGAEVTESHQAHGDTEYRYSYTDGTLKAEKRYWVGEEGTWRTIFEGPYWEFINANPESIEGFTPIRSIPRQYGAPALLSRQQVEANVKSAREALDTYRARFPEGSGNINGLECELQRIEQMQSEYDAMQAFEGHAMPAQATQ